jgi:hypothetical protein
LGSGGVSAEAKEAVFAEVAAKGHEPQASKEKIKESAMRPSDVRFAALGTCQCHNLKKSPENLGGSAK